MKPYQFWTREQLFEHCVVQCQWYKCEDMIPVFESVIFDERWDPIVDYNGCNVIEDRLHPYPPCLKHDFDWLVLGGGIAYDIDFRKNLKKFGESPNMTVVMFVGVRIGWLCWYKWDKMWKRYKKKRNK